ncbi:hypothetical protein BC830DRAFT_223738 [Chytriomyces sp. MP71]|nr:hypothetical protein BC830DRAFT_223738 [Chytriomyces sp. MP71]
MVDGVLHGVPHAWRGFLWYFLISTTSGLTAALLPEEIRDFDEQLVKEFHAKNDLATNTMFAEEISLDAESTVPVHPSRVMKLKRVLCALSQHDATIGYVSSMVHIAAMLLMVMDEERAFIACVHLFSKPEHPSTIQLPSPEQARSWTPASLRRTVSRLSLRSRPETPLSTASTQVMPRYCMKDLYASGWSKFYEMCFVHEKLLLAYAPLLTRKLVSPSNCAPPFAVFSERPFLDRNLTTLLRSSMQSAGSSRCFKLVTKSLMLTTPPCIACPSTTHSPFFLFLC